MTSDKKEVGFYLVAYHSKNMTATHDNIHCQNCRAVNPAHQELCTQCGTRLMLIVNPRINNFEDQMLVEAHSEFLMERVSALENKLYRVVTQMERLVEVMYKQAQASSTEHELVEALFVTLAESGVLDMAEMKKHWQPPAHIKEVREQAEKEEQKEQELAVEEVAANTKEQSACEQSTEKQVKVGRRK